MPPLLVSYIPLRDPSSPKCNEPAFIHYIITMQQQFQAQHPTIPYDKLPKFTFSMYNDLPPVQKIIWEAHAVVDKKRYLTELATYVPPPGYDSKGLAIPTWPKFSFNFFSFEMRQRLQGTNPDLSFEAIGQIILDAWQNLSPNEKQHYNNLELQDKTRFNAEMEEYRPKNHSDNLEINTARSFKMHSHPVGGHASFSTPTITTSLTTNNNVNNINTTNISIKPTGSGNMIMAVPLPDPGLDHCNMFPIAAAKNQTFDSPQILNDAHELDMRSSSIPGVTNLQHCHVDDELHGPNVNLEIFEDVKGIAPDNVVIKDGLDPGLLSVAHLATFHNEGKGSYLTSIQGSEKGIIPSYHATKASPGEPDVFVKAVPPATVEIKYAPPPDPSAPRAYLKEEVKYAKPLADDEVASPLLFLQPFYTYIPHALAGRDILGAAKTRLGKTLAFLVPLVEKLYRSKWSPSDGLSAVILSLTRKLAMQIFDVLRVVGSHYHLSAGLLVGRKAEFIKEQEHLP
jgi:hypothetical protein